MYQSNLADFVCDGLAKIKSGATDRVGASPYKSNLTKRNELLFFFKPEVTNLPESQFRSVLNLAFEIFEKYNLLPTGAFILSGHYVDAHDLAAQHYGVINQIARKGAHGLSSLAQTKFKEVFGVPLEKAHVLGAFEFLHKYPFFDARSLNILWDNCGNTKLAGGTYCAEVLVLGEKIYLLNGFHPFQLRHLTDKGSSLVVVVFQSDTAWATLRMEMLGVTNPEKAAAGSLRRVLWERCNEFGLMEVSQAYNCAHLSAGPLEAIVEIQRFISDHTKHGLMSPFDIAAGKYLIAQGFDSEFLTRLFENPALKWEDERTSPFDLTEEMDLDECAAFLRREQMRLQEAITP